jgi:hypothetical protein
MTSVPILRYVRSAISRSPYASKNRTRGAYGGDSTEEVVHGIRGTACPEEAQDECGSRGRDGLEPNECRHGIICAASSSEPCATTSIPSA